MTNSSYTKRVMPLHNNALQPTHRLPETMRHDNSAAKDHCFYHNLLRLAIEAARKLG
ncbi:MAG TPA: hypothetical protein VGO04_15475 [Ensifer sp.]|jgi:hypothetical protein|uniref:hypothetical protein n=1 Tax=Ensifer sp. TaxID=1872086 RepID=UPI002E101763|nr:hypothetical protein [Ensifer sp.]